MERKEYFEKLDIVKGLAMIFVVFGHCVQCGSGSVFYHSQQFFDDFAFRFIYSFHMPLFMMVSGFLYGKTSSRKPFLQIIKNRSLRLLVPIVVWETMLMLFGLVRGGGINFSGYLYSIITGFWFLWAVWWATIICSLIKKISKNIMVEFVLHAFIIVITFVTPDDLNFSLYKFMYVAFLIGYVVEELNLDGVFKTAILKQYLFLAVLAVIYIILFLIFKRESYIYISGWTLLGKENWPVILAWDIYRIVIGAVGGTLLVCLVYLFVPEGRACWLKDVGKNTSGIYILQTFANSFMIKIFVSVEHHVWLNIIETVVVCTGCFIMVKIVSLIPLASLILFGQKIKRTERRKNE